MWEIMNLDAFPCVRNGDWTMLLDDIKQSSGNRLSLFRWRCQRHRSQLWLQFLCCISNRRSKHFSTQTLISYNSTTLFLLLQCILQTLATQYNEFQWDFKMMLLRIWKMKLPYFSSGQLRVCISFSCLCIW